MMRTDLKLAGTLALVLALVFIGLRFKLTDIAEPSFKLLQSLDARLRSAPRFAKGPAAA